MSSPRRIVTPETHLSGARILSPPATTGGINPKGSASGQTVPLPWGRVAPIVPKFCARMRPENLVAFCAARNKEFFSRRAFYLLNCCTNVVIPAKSLPPRRACARPDRGRGTLRAPVRPPAATKRVALQEGCVRSRPGKRHGFTQPGLGLRPRPEPMAYRTVVILRPPLRRVARTCQA